MAEIMTSTLIIKILFCISMKRGCQKDHLPLSFYCCDQPTSQKEIWGQEGLLHLYFHITVHLRRSAHTAGTKDRKMEAGTKSEAMEK